VHQPRQLAPHRKRHRIAFQRPEIRDLIKELRRCWTKLDKLQQANAIVTLLEAGCTERGLARHLPAKPTTIRRRAMLTQLPQADQESILRGESAKRILADFEERCRLELLEQRLSTPERRDAREREIIDFILRFVHEMHAASFNFIHDNEILRRSINIEERRPRKDRTPKLRREFRKTMLASEPQTENRHAMTHLWNWLAATLVRIEPNSDLLESALKCAVQKLRAKTKPKSLKKRAADLIEKLSDADGFAKRQAIAQILASSDGD
jgi:hypothetical protein